MFAVSLLKNRKRALVYLDSWGLVFANLSADKFTRENKILSGS